MTARRAGWILGLVLGAGLAHSAWLVGVPLVAIGVATALGVAGLAALLRRPRLLPTEANSSSAEPAPRDSNQAKEVKSSQ